MKRVSSISAWFGCFLLGAALLAVSHGTQVRSQSQAQIFSAERDGKKLIVTGENFETGSAITIDGVRQKTKNLADDPTRVLIAKKGGKQIGRAQIVTLQVVSPMGTLSNEFQFFGGPIITFADAGKTIKLVVGEQFLVALGGEFDWMVDLANLTNIVPVPTLIAIPGAQGIFEPVAPGRVSFKADGEPPCRRSKPPCAQPSVLFEATLDIE